MRTRFAPSPTGSLHVGNARIAVLNWLLARRHGGVFILRIEDTDRERNLPGAEATIFRDLRWLGLDWDEGPEFEGRPGPARHGPYRQSERLAGYAAAADRLLEQGLAYPCFCTDAELAAMRDEALARGDARHYDGRCARLSEEARSARLAAGEPAAVRFRVPASGEIVVHDAVRGEIRVRTAEIGDFILLRSDRLPTYNFAVVVDDIGMEITHVIRGAGHLSNTPRQQLLYDALGGAPPVFAHVPTVLGPDRQKLSKRHGARALAEYREDGYHPDGLVNYLSLLSWSSPSGEEVLTRERLIAEISLDRVGAADVVFDPVKLRWLSAKHIERMPIETVVESVRPWLAAPDATLPEPVLREAVGAIRTRLAAFGEVGVHMAEFRPCAEPQRPGAESMPVLRTAREVLSAVQAWERTGLEEALREVSKRTGARGPALYQPLRTVLTCREHGPALTAVLLVQGREAVLGTLHAAAGPAEAG